MFFVLGAAGDVPLPAGRDVAGEGAGRRLHRRRRELRDGLREEGGVHAQSGVGSERRGRQVGRPRVSGDWRLLAGPQRPRGAGEAAVGDALREALISVPLVGS